MKSYARKIPALVLMAAVVSAALLWIGLHEVQAQMTGSTPQTDRLFAEAPADVRAIAERIERGDSVSAAEIAALDMDVNARHGDDITLLFHAVASANIEAVDALLAAGADPRMTDKSTGSERDFIFYLGSPGGPLLDMDGLTALIQAYLRNGGDPRVRLRGKSAETLVSAVALAENLEGVRILLEAGADPWAWDLYEGAPRGTMMSRLAASGTPESFDLLNALVDEGWFLDVEPARLRDFIHALSGYDQRGDERSKAIQALAMRVLKRNPDYVETADYDIGTRSIFKDHFVDEGPAEIPWDTILSEAVR